MINSTGQGLVQSGHITVRPSSPTHGGGGGAPLSQVDPKLVPNTNPLSGVGIVTGIQDPQTGALTQAAHLDSATTSA